MATNYTTNYDLCQWEPTDPVIRTDFNADNAKLETALTALEEAKIRLDRVAVNMAYYTGRFVALELRESNQHQPQHSIHAQVFQSSAGMSLTGGVVVQNNTLVLSGAGKTGSMTTLPYSIGKSDWNQARMWIHSSQDTVVPKLNDVSMEFVGSCFESSLSGTTCVEQEFVLYGTGGTSGKVTLELDTSTHDSLMVYDYYIVYF